MDTFKFSLGQMVSTPGALQASMAAQDVLSSYLIRHQMGDWGIMSDDDKELNNLALDAGARLFSAYLLKDGTKIWVITEAVGDDGRRASTCVLLPEEY